MLVQVGLDQTLVRISLRQRSTGVYPVEALSKSSLVNLIKDEGRPN